MEDRLEPTPKLHLHCPIYTVGLYKRCHLISIVHIISVNTSCFYEKHQFFCASFHLLLLAFRTQISVTQTSNSVNLSLHFVLSSLLF